MKNNIGPFSLTSYISFTLLFFIAKSQLGFVGKDTTWVWYFLIMSGLIQFLNNLLITQYPEICGSYNITSALTATLVPWIFILGLSCVCLVFIPGWLRVFSNTFGHMVANWPGKKALNKIVNDIFTRTSSVSPESKQIADTVNLLFTNSTKFINEIDLDYVLNQNDPNWNKGTNWPSLNKILDFMKINHPDAETYQNLYNALLLKEDMGYFAWLIIIGSISVLISTNSVLVSNCNSVEFNF